MGYDIVVLDLEHGTWNPESADRAIALAKAIGLTVYSRVSGAERVPIQSALDAGADAVIVPQIRNVEHAREAASYAKYPPLGTRGIGHSRINRYGGFAPEFLELGEPADPVHRHDRDPGGVRRRRADRGRPGHRWLSSSARATSR